MHAAHLDRSFISFLQAGTIVYGVCQVGRLEPPMLSLHSLRSRLAYYAHRFGEASRITEPAICGLCTDMHNSCILAIMLTCYSCRVPRFSAHSVSLHSLLV
jgi:hypothetical protein